MKHAVQIEVLRELLQQLDEGVNADAGGVRAAPAETYTCPDLAKKEWARFFRGHPQVVGMSGDLPEPGSFMTTEDFGVPVLVTRDRDGVAHAFLNACRHRGSMVEQAPKGRKTLFTCPFHAWTYDAAGALVGLPMEAHFGAVDRACLGLIELPCVEHLGFLLVHPDPQGVIDTGALFQGVAEDLESWGWGRYVVGLEQTLDMKLNWKLATDTFGETYHFKRLHKDTLANNFHGDVLSYRSYERNHRMILCLKAIDALRDKPEAEWRIEDGGFPVYFLFPNVVINVGAHRIAVVRVYPHPEGPGRSVSKISYYFAPEVLAENPEFAIAFSEGFTRVVAAEDYATAETTQRALASGLLPEVLFGRNEPPLHHYHNTFRKALDLEPLPFLAPAG
ncbi:aromatic ring-hydroxylating dioxygenase subunit alpha [Phenylobacterium sp.]|uniref:aromatic ring-hydroxylating oxygenase subunit alpha n=1 Tax=Phenylobacterium sp. TaxID=1871053 RepID=UPI0026336D3F|nr:aromatic ring-hydroxylating dioxygenase subunit alpha [Phenylobacterium sp.]